MKKLKFIFLIFIIILIYFIYKSNNYKDITYLNITTKLNDVRTYSYNNYIIDNLKENNKLKNTYEIRKNDLMINDLINDIRLNKKINKIGLKSLLRESKIVTLYIGKNDLILERTINNRYQDEKSINNVFKKYKRLLKEINKYNSKIYVIGLDNESEFNDRLKKYINKTDNKYLKDKNLEIRKNVLKSLQYK